MSEILQASQYRPSQNSPLMGLRPSYRPQMFQQFGYSTRPKAQSFQNQPLNIYNMRSGAAQSQLAPQQQQGLASRSGINLNRPSLDIGLKTDIGQLTQKKSTAEVPGSIWDALIPGPDSFECLREVIVDIVSRVVRYMADGILPSVLGRGGLAQAQGLEGVDSLGTATAFGGGLANGMATDVLSGLGMPMAPTSCPCSQPSLTSQLGGQKASSTSIIDGLLDGLGLGQSEQKSQEGDAFSILGIIKNIVKGASGALDIFKGIKGGGGIMSTLSNVGSAIMSVF